MLEYQTTEKLTGMRLSVMASEYRRQMEAPDTKNLSFEERFSMIVDAEWLSRENNRTEKLLCRAKLREHASLADIDYDPFCFSWLCDQDNLVSKFSWPAHLHNDVHFAKLEE